MIERRGTAIAAMVVALAACGADAPSATSVEALGLPVGSASTPLARTTVSTSPDGGIYRNPDDLLVVLAARGSARPLASRLGTTAEWHLLEPLGGVTYVGIRLRNDGKVGSDPRLSDLQVASDLAPDGTASGPLRRFYHPTYPLAVLSDVTPSSDCGVHLDPSQTALVLIVYPPSRPAPRLTWGRYHDFSLDIAWGGRLPAGTGDLRAVSCPSPAPPA